MSVLNPTPGELDDLLVRIANGLPGHALDATAALASLRAALDQKAEAIATLTKALKRHQAYANSMRSVQLEFDEPTDQPIPIAPSSPPRLTVVRTLEPA